MNFVPLIAVYVRFAYIVLHSFDYFQAILNYIQGD